MAQAIDRDQISSHDGLLRGRPTDRQSMGGFLLMGVASPGWDREIPSKSSLYSWLHISELSEKPANLPHSFKTYKVCISVV